MDYEQKVSEMKSLRNIGPTCAKYLVEAGIDTPEKLRRIGAKEALLNMFEQGVLNVMQMHPCYLYALQGAIDDVDWCSVSEVQKEDFKKFCRELKRSVGN